MEMIGHQTIRQKSHRHTRTRLSEQADEGLIISLRMKHLRATIPSIDHVITVVAD